MEIIKYHIMIRSEEANRVEQVLSDNAIPFSRITVCDSCEHWFECDESGSGFCENI